MFKAAHPPVVIITSNRTREVHDALKRRCLYYWIDYPDFQKEMQIISSRLPDAPRRLAEQVTGFVQELRETELYKIPGISETLDWTSALLALNQRELEPEVIDDTLGLMLKYQDDIEQVRGEASAGDAGTLPQPGATKGRTAVSVELDETASGQFGLLAVSCQLRACHQSGQCSAEEESGSPRVFYGGANIRRGCFESTGVYR